ncbi:polyphenol oxidase family protein [Thermodesulfobacteriota bacterium]
MCAIKAGKETTLNKKYQESNAESPNAFYYFQFPLLSGQNQLIHGVFTRHGGVSESPYNSLNTGYNTGDKPESVKKNLQIISETIGAGHLIFMNQVHGRDILTFSKDNHRDFGTTADADAVVTDIPSVALMVKQADCQGIILFDAVKAVISIVHCGWRGNTCNILGSVVRKMRSEFGCTVSDMLAAIGPSLGPCCAEFITYKDIFPEEFGRFMVRKNYFNLWEISRRQLLEAGLREDKIEIAGICSRCNVDLFYSYRAEGITGRFATVAMLREE